MLTTIVIMKSPINTNRPRVIWHKEWSNITHSWFDFQEPWGLFYSKSISYTYTMCLDHIHFFVSRSRSPLRIPHSICFSIWCAPFISVHVCLFIYLFLNQWISLAQLLGLLYKIKQLKITSWRDKGSKTPPLAEVFPAVGGCLGWSRDSSSGVYLLICVPCGCRTNWTQMTFFTEVKD